MSKIGKLFFCDCETTDLPDNDPEAEIIEIACAILDVETWRVSGEWSTLVRHSRPYGDLTAATFSKVNFGNALDLDLAVAGLFRRWRESGGAWIGQNPDFDRGMLRPAARSCGVPWPHKPEVDYHVFDVASMMLPYLVRGEVGGVGLKTTRVWAGCQGEQSHRAMGDVRDTIRVFSKIMGAQPDALPGY